MDVSTEPVKPAQTTAPETEPTGWMSPTGEVREGSPESVQKLMEAKKWTTMEQVVSGYNELEKFQGIGNHLVIPEAEDAEGWENVYKSLGRPEEADKYEVAYEGEVQISDELTSSFKQFAHKVGLTQKQFNDVVNFQLDAVTAQLEAAGVANTTKQEANVATLKEKYGEANYGAKVTGARIIADSLGIYNTLEAKGLASDPDIIDMLVTINERTSEDVITPQPPPAPPKSLQDQLKDIKENPAYMDKFHADHKAVMVQYMALNQEIANSGQAKQPRI